MKEKNGKKIEKKRLLNKSTVMVLSIVQYNVEAFLNV